MKNNNSAEYKPARPAHWIRYYYWKGANRDNATMGDCYKSAIYRCSNCEEYEYECKNFCSGCGAPMTEPMECPDTEIPKSTKCYVSVERQQVDDAVKFLDNHGVKYKFYYDDHFTAEFIYESTPYNEKVFMEMILFLKNH